MGTLHIMDQALSKYQALTKKVEGQRSTQSLLHTLSLETLTSPPQQLPREQTPLHAPVPCAAGLRAPSSPHQDQGQLLPSIPPPHLGTGPEEGSRMGVPHLSPADRPLSKETGP